MTLLKTLALAGAVSVCAGAGSAATYFDVSAPVAENRIHDGETYGTALSIGDTMSAWAITTISDTDGVLGIASATPAGTILSLVFDQFDALVYGTLDVYLTTDGTRAGAVGSGTVTGAGQGVDLVATFTSSPLYLLFDWSEGANNWFHFDVAVAPVPVPAAGLMLLAGLGGLAALRRRTSAA